MIVRSKPQANPRSITRTLLRSLKVPFQEGMGFWMRNEAGLEYIFADFLKAAKRRKRELHPDLGGSSEEFQNFSVLCDMAERQFRRRLRPTIDDIQNKIEKRAQQYEHQKRHAILWNKTPKGKAYRRKWKLRRRLTRQ